MIKIQVVGSFSQRCEHTCSAMQHGHAAAVAEAIRWLYTEVMPDAIKLDHEVQVEGAAPTHGFGK